MHCGAPADMCRHRHCGKGQRRVRVAAFSQRGSLPDPLEFGACFRNAFGDVARGRSCGQEARITPRVRRHTNHDLAGCAARRARRRRALHRLSNSAPTRAAPCSGTAADARVLQRQTPRQTLWGGRLALVGHVTRATAQRTRVPPSGAEVIWQLPPSRRARWAMLASPP